MVGIILNDLASIRPNQIETASKVISKAFYNDPLMEYLFPRPVDRKIKLPIMMELLLRIGIKYGIVHITSSRLEGIAISFPSNKVKITPWMGFLNGGLFYFFKLGIKCVIKQNNLYNYIYSMHKYLMPRDHWYLSIIGIDPTYQGIGLSHVLFDLIFNQIDEENLPCFLDTNNKDNISFYRHFGFRILKEYKIPNTNIVNWAMIREL